jgi:Tol biopolymer transport system component
MVLLALLAAGASSARSSHASSPGTIVFASDRDKLDPGEIYSVGVGSKVRDVSRSLAPDYGLAVAPVGDQIAFWSARGGRERVYLARGDGSRLRAVRGLGGPFAAQDFGGGGSLSFSADGRSLVTSYSHRHATTIYRIDVRSAAATAVHTCDGGFLAASPDGALAACDRGGQATVYDMTGAVRFHIQGPTLVWSSTGTLAAGNSAVVPPDVGTTRIVTSSGKLVERAPGIPVAWSRDGRLLALARGQSLVVGRPGDLAHARRLAQVWSGGFASFTPDDRYVSTEGDGGDPVLEPVDGGAPIDGLDAGGGAWSHDGRLAYTHVSFPVGVGATVPVLITDPHGEHPQVVGRFPYDENGYARLDWLPDGRHVLFETGSCGGKGLYAVPANGGPVRALDHDPRDEESPTWSPDGTRIAYSVEDHGCNGHGEPIHIETISADGTDATRVTSVDNAGDGSADGRPFFSPDGTRIAYEHDTVNDGSLEAVPVGGGTPTVIQGGAPGAWSPDGTRIAFVSGHSIMAVPSTGGTPSLLAPDPSAGGCGYTAIAWSPDGGEIAIAGGRGIYLVTLGAQPSSRLAIRARCTGDPSFSPDGKRLTFDSIPAGALGEQTSIMVANVDGSGLRTLTSVPFRISVHPSWQP